jgi:protein-tyrosine phosphatase
MPVNTLTPPELPKPRQPFGPYKICLVCLGNICRSPMAEAVLRAELARAGLAGAVSVESAGTGDWHLGERMHGPAEAELARRGYDGSAHRSRQIQRSWLAGYDLLVAMDRRNLASLRRMAPDAETAGRVRLLREFDPALAASDPYDGDVPDPYGAPRQYYALAFDLVLAGVRGLVGQLAELLGETAQHQT